MERQIGALNVQIHRFVEFTLRILHVETAPLP